MFSQTTCINNVLLKDDSCQLGWCQSKGEQEGAAAWKGEEKRGPVRNTVSKSGCFTRRWAGFNYQNDVRLCTLSVLSPTLDLNWFLRVSFTSVQYKMPKYWDCPPWSFQFGPCSWSLSLFWFCRGASQRRQCVMQFGWLKENIKALPDWIWRHVQIRISPATLFYWLGWRGSRHWLPPPHSPPMR